MRKPAFKRILLKLSGEALGGSKEHGIDPAAARTIASEIKGVYDAGVQIGIVVGGGNIYRGASGSEGVGRVAGDSMGMLATVINSIALHEYFDAAGIPSSVYTSVSIDKAGKLFIREDALKDLDDGRAVIVAGGTGNPFFTTDTAAALRAAELEADLLVKATKVDGVYDADPVRNPGARKFETISYAEALSRNLKVMDATAFSFCMENAIPIVVLKLMDLGNLYKCVVDGAKVGSIISTKG
jgi:uridylate kinase